MYSCPGFVPSLAISPMPVRRSRMPRNGSAHEVPTSGATAIGALRSYSEPWLPTTYNYTYGSRWTDEERLGVNPYHIGQQARGAD